MKKYLIVCAITAPALVQTAGADILLQFSDTGGPGSWSVPQLYAEDPVGLVDVVVNGPVHEYYRCTRTTHS